MPYQIIGSKTLGFFVINMNTGKAYSKQPMPLARARKQLTALQIHTKDTKGR